MKKLVFFFKKQHVIGGSLVFLLGVAKYISEFYKDYEVYYVNIPNRELEELYGAPNIRYVDIDNCDFTQFENADFVLPVNHIFLLMEKARFVSKGRIMLYDWHPHQIYYLLNQFYNIPKVKNETLELFWQTNSLYFMDQSCKLSVNKEFDKPFNTQLVPVFSVEKSQNYIELPLRRKHRIQIGWMSRLDEDKISSLVNLADNLFLIDSDEKIDLHIIGDGACRNKLDIQRYSPKIRFLFTSYLVGEERNQYIRDNVDLMVVMGISALDVANLSVPVVIPSISNELFYSNQFVYLFDTQDYSLGWDKSYLKELKYPTKTIQQVINDIHCDNGKIKLGKLCYDFANQNFSIEKTAELLQKSITNSQLTLELCRKNPVLSQQMKMYFLYKRIRFNKKRDYDSFVMFNTKLRRLKEASTFEKINYIFTSWVKNPVEEFSKKALRKYKRIYTIIRNIKDYWIVQHSYPKKIEAIRKIVEHNRKLKVAFLVIFSTTFPSEAIFEEMLRDSFFDPYIIVIPDMFRSREHKIDTYRQTCLELKAKYGDKVIEAFDPISDEYLELGNQYPIIFFSNPYINMAHKFHHVTYFRDLNVLPLYINYGFAAVDYGKNVITTDFYNLMWKVCVESELNLQYVKKHEWIKGYNAVVTGYAKMDRLAKIEVRERSRKKIIICPHHTVMGWSALDISNFLTYSELFIKLPQLYSNIDFVFRPHPLLFNNLLEKRIWSKAQIDDYLTRMLLSPNMKYDHSGDYFDLFVNSDAMIHDCGSFTGEYLFTEKPCCYMLKSRQQIQKDFQPMGQECLKHYYKAYSQQDIIEFIEKVVIKEIDPLKNAREEFSRTVLKFNYPNSAGMVLRLIKKICEV